MTEVHEFLNDIDKPETSVIEVVENKIDDVVNLKDRFTDAISEE